MWLLRRHVKINNSFESVSLNQIYTICNINKNILFDVPYYKKRNRLLIKDDNVIICCLY